MKKVTTFLVIGALTITVLAQENDSSPSQNSPTSFETIAAPGPLFSFGQNILKKNHKVISSAFYNISGLGREFNILYNSFLYGVTNDFSMLITIPVVPEHKISPPSSNPTIKSHGISDLDIQGEYAAYRHISANALHAATVLARVTFPTSKLLVPFTGFTTYSIRLGYTLSHSSLRWYAYNTSSITFAPTYKHRKVGNIITYDFGLGYIPIRRDTSYLAFLIELSGFYLQKTKVNKVIDPNSGRNLILLGPSIRWFYHKFTFQTGFQFPIADVLTGTQINTDYQLAVGIAYTF